MSQTAKDLLAAMRQRRVIAKSEHPDFLTWNFLNERVGRLFLSLCVSGGVQRERGLR